MRYDLWQAVKRHSPPHTLGKMAKRHHVPPDARHNAPGRPRSDRLAKVEPTTHLATQSILGANRAALHLCTYAKAAACPDYP